MEDHGSVTSREAIEDYGCYRLASRVADIKRLGIPVYSKMEHSHNRYGEPVSYKRYSLTPWEDKK
jgi:hypothetical protein